MNYLFLALTACAALAGDLPASTFVFKEGEQAFVTDEARQLLISASCRRPDGKFQCEAFSKMKALSWKKRRTGEGEGNPATHLCEKQMKGVIVVGKNQNGDENTFCRMPDGSLVDGGSIIYRARKND